MPHPQCFFFFSFFLLEILLSFKCCRKFSYFNKWHICRSFCEVLFDCKACFILFVMTSFRWKFKTVVLFSSRNVEQIMKTGMNQLSASISMTGEEGRICLHRQKERENVNDKVINVKGGVESSIIKL